MRNYLRQLRSTLANVDNIMEVPVFIDDTPNEQPSVNERSKS